MVIAKREKILVSSLVFDILLEEQDIVMDPEFALHLHLFHEEHVLSGVQEILPALRKFILLSHKYKEVVQKEHAPS